MAEEYKFYTLHHYGSIQLEMGQVFNDLVGSDWTFDLAWRGGHYNHFQNYKLQRYKSNCKFILILDGHILHLEEERADHYFRSKR